MEILQFIAGVYLFFVIGFVIPWLLSDNNSKLDKIIKLLELGKTEESKVDEM